MAHSLPTSQHTDSRSSRKALPQRTAVAIRRVALWLESRPWNLPGTDKAWMVRAIEQHLGFRRAVRRAARVDAR